MARVDASLPTAVMRSQLRSDGVAVPGEARLLELSREYNEGLERVRKLENKEGFSWINLFREMDDEYAQRAHDSSVPPRRICRPLFS